MYLEINNNYKIIKMNKIIKIIKLIINIIR